jgi:hypothetical protein
MRIGSVTALFNDRSLYEAATFDNQLNSFHYKSIFIPLLLSFTKGQCLDKINAKVPENVLLLLLWLASLG